MIKILGYTYKLINKDGTDEINAFGRQHSRRQIIQIANDIHLQQTESTILHEIIEAVNYHLSLDINHQSIMGLEAGLYQVFTDNGIDLSPLLKRVDINDN